MTETKVLFALLLVMAIGYPIVMRLLAVKAQPFRVELYKLGDRLLDSPSLNPIQKKLIESMMDDAFSARIMLAAAIALPVFIIRRALRVRMNNSLTGFSSPLQDQISEFQNCYLHAVAAANPICATIVLVEFVLLWLPLRLAGIIKNAGSRSNEFRAHEVKINAKSDMRLFVSEIESQRCHA